MPPRKRLGQLLTELGVIDEHQLQSALGHQKQWGGKLGAVLVQKGFCKENEVVSALSKHLGMPAVRLADQRIDQRAVAFVSKQIAEKLHVFPYEVSGSGRSEVVTIAMSDPTDLSAVDQLAFHTGKRIKPMLAGDSEIVSAIQQHYAAPEPAAPAPSPAKPPAPAPPAAAAPAFPKRIEASAAQSMPTPPGGQSRISPYVPPPIPAAPPRPAPKLDEIEPDADEMTAAAAPKAPEPLEIPEDDSGGADGQMMGLEPIAAHSQFGEAVSGAEEVAGEGSAADSVEGLESAGVPHEGAEAAQSDQMQGLEAIAAHSQEPAAEGGWQTEQASSWDAAPTGEEASPASGDFGASQDWSAEQPAAEAEQGWGAEAAAAGESPGEQLPMDAILGEAGADEAQAPAEEQEAPAEAPQPGAEAEAPDAWASSEDPLASPEQPAEQSWAEQPPAEQPPPPAEAGEASAAETEAPPEWGEMPAEEPAAQEESVAAEEAAPPEPAAEEAAPPEEPAPEEAAAAEQPLGEQAIAEEELPSEQFSEEQGELKLEGWVAPPAEPEPQGAGWLGEALEATAPLSPNDVGTLSSIGVDPNDGVAALRALAAILRVLNRRQMLDVDEIASEIRESRAQGAAYAAQQQAEQLADGTPGEEAAPAEESPPPPESGEPAET